MKEKLLKQSGICLAIILALFLAKQSGIDFLERGADAVMKQMKVNYTAEDVRELAGRSGDVIAAFSGRFGESVNVMMQKPSLGEPIDQTWKGNQTSVHAVAAGQVAAVGENEEIGIYVRIVHENLGESLYGNLQESCVTVPQKVKKGQIIGTFSGKDPSNFYYSFQEFK